MNIVLLILMYFGTFTIPAVYCCATRFHGRLTKRMLIGVGLQVFWSLGVWAVVWYSWKRGDSEYFYAWAYLIPVNLVGLMYFIGTLLSGMSNTERAEQ
jgi:hypothetical protein